MRKLTIRVVPKTLAFNEMKAGFIDSWKSGEYQGEFLSFESPALLFKTLTQKRWEIITSLQAQSSPISIRELARQIGRDIRRVHDDVTVLIVEGIIEQGKDGISVVFDEIHADFTMKKAA